MADVLDLLSDALDAKGIAALASALGIDGDQAATLVKVALPVLLERLGENARSGGAEQIASAAAEDHDGSVLDVAAGFLGGGFKQGPGMAILQHVFGDQLDSSIATVAGTTGLPPSVVRLGFSALAPLVMGALTKAAIGAVTAVVVIKLLDVAVDQFRSGRVQRFVGNVNDSLDDDADGSAVDDVGRSAAGAAKKAGATVVSVSKSVARSPRTKAVADKGVGLLKKGWRRFGRR